MSRKRDHEKNIFFNYKNDFELLLEIGGLDRMKETSDESMRKVLGFLGNVKRTIPFEEYYRSEETGERLRKILSLLLILEICLVIFLLIVPFALLKYALVINIILYFIIRMKVERHFYSDDYYVFLLKEKKLRTAIYQLLVILSLTLISVFLNHANNYMTYSDFASKAELSEPTEEKITSDDIEIRKIASEGKMMYEYTICEDSEEDGDCAVYASPEEIIADKYDVMKISRKMDLPKMHQNTHLISYELLFLDDHPVADTFVSIEYVKKTWHSIYLVLYYLSQIFLIFVMIMEFIVLGILLWHYFIYIKLNIEETGEQGTTDQQSKIKEGDM